MATGPTLIGVVESAMKIGPNPDTASAQAQATAAKQARTSAPVAQDAVKNAPSAAAAGVPVTVTLSQVARGYESARNTGDFDAAKVKAIKAAIEKGTFKVDAEAIADKLLANAQETLSLARG